VKKVVATGTFDILHPGHLFYLGESRRLGDELHVIVARDVNVKHKPRPVIPEDQRLLMVQALRVVDHARLGDPEDMMRPIQEIGPDIITLGFNQHFQEDDLKRRLDSRGITARIVRIGHYGEATYCSSSRIVQEVLARRSADPGPGHGR
jgi:FAD synthetase